MQLKPEVNTQDTKPEIWYALGVAEVIHRSQTNRPLTVTSLNDGQHIAGSLHYQGLAADIRTRDILSSQRFTFRSRLLQSLWPLGYDVIDEGDHIHIEYDPKNQRTLAVRQQPPTPTQT